MFRLARGNRQAKKHYLKTQKVFHVHVDNLSVFYVVFFSLRMAREGRNT